MSKLQKTAARRIANAIRLVVIPSTLVLVILILAFDIYDDDIRVQTVRDKFDYVDGKSGVFHDKIRSGTTEDILDTIPDVIKIYIKLFAYAENINPDNAVISPPHMVRIDKRYSVAYGEIDCDSQILDYSFLLDNNYDNLFDKVDSLGIYPPYDIKYADAAPQIYSRTGNKSLVYQFDLQRVMIYGIAEIRFTPGSHDYYIRYSVDIIRIVATVLIVAGISFFILKRRLKSPSAKKNI